MIGWRQLPWLTGNDLARLDIAAVNLICADGLPGTDQYDAVEIIRKIDFWAAESRRYTDLALADFRRRPAHYQNSEPFFRAIALVTVLQRHLGLRYNPAKIPDDVPHEPTDTFIHGAVLGQWGTCASIPVVLAAVGRRLGYPIRLATCLSEKWGHVFARWDQPGEERFNIEATSQGMSSPPDDYYREGLYGRTRLYEAFGGFLRSMTPREELAGFLSQRACHGRDLGKLRQAAESFAYASALVPENSVHLDSLKMTLNAWLDELNRSKPPGFPDLYVKRMGRRFPPGLPLDLERDILGKEATDNALRNPELEQRFWSPMRAGRKPDRWPARLQATTYVQGRCELGIQFATREERPS